MIILFYMCHNKRSYKYTNQKGDFKKRMSQFSLRWKHWNILTFLHIVPKCCGGWRAISSILLDTIDGPLFANIHFSATFLWFLQTIIDK